jgi:hypothetical protein
MSYGPRFDADPDRSLVKEKPTLNPRIPASLALILALLLALLVFPTRGRAAVEHFPDSRTHAFRTGRTGSGRESYGHQLR